MTNTHLWRLRMLPQARPAADALAAELTRIPAPPCAADPQVWFGDDDDRAVAALICGDCTAAPECLEFAVANDERFGVWGGTDMGRRAAEQAEKERALLTVGQGHTEGERSA